MLEEGQQHDWFSSRFISTMAVASVVGLTLFIRRELSVEHPAVDIRVLRYPSMIGGSIYSAILGMGIYGIMFAVPVFVQDYLHFTALQSGELLVPGAIASAVAMILYGKIAHFLPPPILICIGALLTVVTGVLLKDINPGTGVHQLFWPLICRGLGGVLIFMPLSIATLGPLPKKDIASGAGFYSLTRQLGSSIGIALITTMLARRQAVHRATLVENITSFRQPVTERLQLLANGFASHRGDASFSQRRAFGVLDGLVNSQATLKAYEDLFFYAAVLFLFSLPLILLLRQKPKSAAEDAAAAAAH
jgi:DHA2 family multidrug resistance protein